MGQEHTGGEPPGSAESADDDPFEACAHCGDSFDPGVRYPVETREGPDGEIELYSFCGQDCRSAWTGD